jgi:uncharacterized DUF497 family protein
MNDNIFEWDLKKAKANFAKHRVTFDEGATIFNDPFVITITDPAHSETEQRYLSMGLSFKGRLLVVVHVERDNRTRLISCRKATSHERKTYENINK